MLPPMKRGHVLAVLILAVPIAAAQAELRRPQAGRWFVEPGGGVVIPLTGLEIKDDAWLPRGEIAAKAGLRVWEPLNLDAGLRIGYSWQSHHTTVSASRSYAESIDLFDLGLFGRAAIFPFEGDEWGISLELGGSLMLASGGVDRANPVFSKTQMFVRIRVGFGAVWRWNEGFSLQLDALHLVTDAPVTTEAKNEVGTQLALEPHVGVQWRF